MGFLKPSVPAPPPPPPAPPPPAVTAVKPAEVKKLEAELRDPKKVGRAKTIVTGPRGLTAEDDERVYKRSLIGSKRDTASSS